MHKFFLYIIPLAFLGAGCGDMSSTPNANESKNTSAQQSLTKNTNTSNTNVAMNTTTELSIPAKDTSNFVKTDSGLQYMDIEVGDGAEAVDGKTVSVHYTGMLEDGTQFDSSLDRNETFEFLLGSGMVIKGWDEGVAGMKVGGTRVLVIPAELGYGDRGAGAAIPPGATLHFQVQLVEVN